jgi:hypothetical protein
MKSDIRGLSIFWGMEGGEGGMGWLGKFLILIEIDWY